MNKRQKIIISIVGITIVLLALLGITYAYYLTRIQGNTNTNSISVTTAKLELVYGDNSAEIIRGTGALMPTVETDADDAIGTKTFTVTNNGDDSSYVVIIDNVSVTKASDGSTTTFVSNDFRYTLTCSVKDKSGNAVTTESCNDVESLSIFPIKGGILVGNDIPEDRVHEYTLTLWYIDTGIDQSDDMGKSLQARVNIKDMTAVNPFSTGVSATDNASLVYNIINNAKTNKNGTTLVNAPLTTPAVSSSAKYVKADDPTSFTSSRSSATSYYITYSDYYTINEKDGNFTLINKDGSTPITAKYTGTAMAETLKGKYAYWSTNENTAKNVTNISSIYKITTTEGDIAASTIKYATISKKQVSAESVLSVTTDDYGTSYYYRGGVTDNYVNFAGMCWRIVRIEGDGSVKLILESQNVCSEDMESNFSIGIADWGYKYENNKYIGDYKNSTSGMKNLLNTWFDTNFKSEGNLTNAGLKVKDEEWCLGDKAYSRGESYPYIYTPLEEYNYSSSMYYDAYVRLSGYNKNGFQPTLKCNGEKDISQIGALTADEVVYAGGKADEENYNYYLQNDSCWWWTLSRSGFDGTYDHAFIVSSNGDLNVDDYNYVDLSNSVRPAVSLNTGVKITEGVGTKKNPYIINEG